MAKAASIMPGYYVEIYCVRYSLLRANAQIILLFIMSVNPSYPSGAMYTFLR